VCTFVVHLESCKHRYEELSRLGLTSAEQHALRRRNSDASGLLTVSEVIKGKLRGGGRLRRTVLPRIIFRCFQHVLRLYFAAHCLVHACVHAHTRCRISVFSSSQGGPSYGAMHAGDIVLSVGGAHVDNFVDLEDILDRSVGKSVR
jgi:hypothetical protein